MLEKLYHYIANVKSVYDGDTCTLVIDLGLKMWSHDVKIRLYGIDTPEVRGEERPEGLEARDYLRSLIDGKQVFVQTIKDRTGKYGRYLGVIWLEDEQSGEWINVNERMVQEGFAVRMNYD